VVVVKVLLPVIVNPRLVDPVVIVDQVVIVMKRVKKRDVEEKEKEKERSIVVTSG